MADEIKVGDTVQLKSGGPKMTVSQVDTPQYKSALHAWCDWFEGTKAIHGDFPLTSLKRLD
jgi:uncharacterized protein YodC (DUF2158 family)